MNTKPSTKSFSTLLLLTLFLVATVSSTLIGLMSGPQKVYAANPPTEVYTFASKDGSRISVTGGRFAGTATLTFSSSESGCDEAGNCSAFGSWVGVGSWLDKPNCKFDVSLSHGDGSGSKPPSGTQNLNDNEVSMSLDNYNAQHGQNCDTSNFPNITLDNIIVNAFGTRNGAGVTDVALPDGKACPTGEDGTPMVYAGNNQCVADATKGNNGKLNCDNFPNAKLIPGKVLSPTSGATSPATCKSAVIDATSTSTDSCAIDAGWALRWLACPVVDSLQLLLEGPGHSCTGGICALITAYLTTPSSEIFGANGTPSDQTSRSFYTAWNNFRVIGIALIVIAALIMIFSEALGFSFVDAYTIRKVLPRLLIAAIVITLSWSILYFVVNLFNDLGTAIRGIMVTPFHDIKGVNVTFGTALANWLAPLVGFVALGPFGLLSLLGTAALALLVAMFVLIIREGVIDILIITAPLWMALYVLPNTQKLSHAAGDTLIRALAMFPFIMAFWTAGDILSVILSTSHLVFSSFASELAGLMGPAGAVFAFRFAGGAVATIGGFVNDRSRGGFDRLKKFRAGQIAYRHQQRMEGDTVLGSGRTGSIYRRAFSTREGGLSFTRLGRERYEAAEKKRRNAIAAKRLEEDNGFISGDDDTMAAAHDATSRDDFVNRYMARTHRSRKEAIAAMAAAETGFGTRMGSDTMRVAAFKARQASVTGYGDTDEAFAERFNDAIAMRKSGLMTASDAMAAIKQNKARAEASGVSFGAGLQVIQNGGHGANGTLTRDDVNALSNTMLDGLTPGSLIGARREAGAHIARHLQRQVDEAVAAAGGNLNDTGVKRLIGHIAGVQDTINSQAPQMAREFANGLLSQPIGTGGLRVRDYSDQLRAAQDSAFNDVRKEWLSGIPPGTQPGAGTPPPTPTGGGAPSDIRLKRSITPLLRTADGIQLYSFQYLWSDQVYVGVMAQDLVATHPEALSIDSFGFYHVDYDKLGLQMLTLEEWERSRAKLPA